MDALSIILRTVRESMAATGVPPDPLQDALQDAERACRRTLGGGMHHISRMPQVTAKARVIDLAQQGLGNTQIAERLAISDGYVRRITRMLRAADGGGTTGGG